MAHQSFFEKSQNVKREICSDSNLLKSVKGCFFGKINPFSEGTENEIYRLGKTSSGIYLALRKRRFSMDFEHDIRRYEIYCQNAETLATSRAEGKYLYRPVAVSFCIGMKVNSHEAGIITEDLSEGGKYAMTNNMADLYSERLLHDKVVDEVFVDLDSCRPDGYFKDSEVISTTAYFSPENVLEI